MPLYKSAAVDGVVVVPVLSVVDVPEPAVVVASVVAASSPPLQAVSNATTDIAMRICLMCFIPVSCSLF